MYKLYFWYAWDFGRWNFICEAPTKEELHKYINDKKRNTYKITDENGNIIEIHKAPPSSYRLGMVAPKE